VQICFTFDAPDRIPVSTGLRHIDVDRDLPQAAFHDEPFQILRLLDQRLPVRHQHRDRAD
jgi:hypothetical protein